jgi:hypothetical protein
MRTDDATLRHAEESATFNSDVKNDSNRQLEDGAVTTTHIQPSQSPIQGTVSAKKRKVGPILAIFLTIFGGGAAFSTLYAPGITLLHFTEVIGKDTNSLIAAAEKTDMQLWRAKLKDVRAGSCGAIKIACRFKTVNIEKTTANFKRAGITLEFDKSAGWGEKRGKITKMSFTDQFGKTIDITSPDQLNDARKNTEFRKAMLAAHNPKFATLKDAPAINFLKKMKTSYAKKLTGNTKEELDKNMQDAVDGKVSLNTPRLKPEVDDEGKETGRYVDDKGQVYTAEEAKGLNVAEDMIKNAPTSAKVLDGLVKGASITGAADTACTVNNMSNAVETGAKLIRARELIRFAMVLNNTTGAMKAGDATPEQVEYLGKKIVEPDMREMVVDESKWYEEGTKDNPPMTKNPNYKKSGLDAIFYKMSAYQDKPNITSREQRFMAGGGMTGTLGKVNTLVAKALGGGSKKDLRQKCKVVQNPAVRGGSLVVGIIAGIGSFGWLTALGVAGSLAFSFAIPYLTSMLSDMVAGNVTGPDLSGVDMINAASIGTSATLNGNARVHGLMPLSPEQMVEYQNTNRQVQVAYEQIERYDAQKTPFDITNQYSFLGSLARTTLPMATAVSTGSVATSLQSVPYLLSTAASTVIPHASAITDQKVSIERYQMCNDETYKEMNVAADPTCVLLYGLPPEAMEIDPIVNAEWMAARDEILADSDIGAPKDNKRDWNYKKFLEDCIVQQPGAHEDGEENDDNGSGCSEPANFVTNWHYAKFKLSVEIALGQDGELPGVDGGSQDNFSEGESGPVGANGWAYPTTSDAAITSGFGPRWGAEHRGIDLVPPNALGKPIFAARDGKVIAAGPADGFGNWIVIKHDDVDGKRYDTVYGHMATEGVFVKAGDSVTAGQEIGKIGNEGESTGPHLHFEIWENGHTNFAGGTAIDPAPIIRGAHDPNPSAEVRT